MALNIVKSQQSSGRVPAGEDFKSGLIGYGTAPVVAGKWKEYSSSLYPSVVIKAQQLFSVDDAINAGIVSDTENTASTGTFKITTIGATGDNLVLVATVPIFGRTTANITLCNYTVAVADTTKILQAASIVAAINAGTYSTGWSATTDGVDMVTLIAPKKYGVALNSGTVYTKTIIGAMVGTLVQNLIPGTASVYHAWYYQINGFFTMFPQGNIWFGIIDLPDYDFKEVLALQSASGNSIRLIGVYNHESNDDLSTLLGDVQKLQARAIEIDQTFPLEIVYSPNIATTLLNEFVNGQSVRYNKVSLVISQDGMAEGNWLFGCCGFTIGNIGYKIATLAKSRVSSSDAQAIDIFNLSDGTENAYPAFGNGTLLSTVASSLIDQLKAFRYIFFRVFTGNVVGTYWNGNHCFCEQTSRYAYMNDNRIASKITRICNKVYIPLMEQETIYNQDGTLTNDAIEIFQDAGVDAITAECITGFGSMPLISGAPVVTIDPKQELQKTNNLNIVVQVGENGIARDITIYQGFTN